MVQDTSQVEVEAVVSVGKDLEEMAVAVMLLMALELEAVELQILEAVVLKQVHIQVEM